MTKEKTSIQFIDSKNWQNKYKNFKHYRSATAIEFRNNLNALKEEGDAKKLLTNLQDYANFILFRPKRDTLRRMRSNFNVLRYIPKCPLSRIRNDLLRQACFVCDLESDEIHHIISLHNGGLPIQKANLIPICRDCHCKIHPWMNRKTNDKRKNFK